jgi:hypothetical protein
VKRKNINYFINIGILVSVIITVVTGIIKWPGLITAIGLTYNSLPMELLTSVHDWCGLLMFVLSFAHIILHWKWIKTMTTQILIKGDN